MRGTPELGFQLGLSEKVAKFDDLSMFATFRLDLYENPILQCLSNAPVYLFLYSGFGESFGRLLRPI